MNHLFYLQSSFTTLAQQVEDSLTQERLLAALSGFFGALALLLAMIGFYGLLAYLLEQRRKEIGIRMALGAPRGAILSLVMRDVRLAAARGSDGGIGDHLGDDAIRAKLAI